MIYLNLGCGNNPLPKPWKNIDKFYYPGTEEMNRADGNPEDFDWEQGDFTELSKWEDNSVDKVNICHALEHVSDEDAWKTLREIYRVLKPGGDVEIEVPDLDKIFMGFMNKLFSESEMIDLVYGGRDSNVYWGGHFCGFNIYTLSHRLLTVGFSNVKEIYELGFGTSKAEPDRNFRVRGTK
jgi:ubiquinone/menaquinone biosynthesis C-methylase UbiE